MTLNIFHGSIPPRAGRKRLESSLRITLLWQKLLSSVSSQLRPRVFLTPSSPDHTGKAIAKIPPNSHQLLQAERSHLAFGRNVRSDRLLDGDVCICKIVIEFGGIFAIIFPAWSRLKRKTLLLPNSGSPSSLMPERGMPKLSKSLFSLYHFLVEFRVSTLSFRTLN